MIFRFNHFVKEDVLVEPEIQTEIDHVVRFSEYRKGSSKYGETVKAIMMWLRTYRKDASPYLVTPISKFLRETNIKLDELEKFIEDLPNTKLISFSIEIKNGSIIFMGLNNTIKNRLVWEK